MVGEFERSVLMTRDRRNEVPARNIYGAWNTWSVTRRADALQVGIVGYPSDVLKKLCDGRFWRGNRGRHQIIKDGARGCVVGLGGLMIFFHGVGLLVGVF